MPGMAEDREGWEGQAEGSGTELALGVRSAAAARAGRAWRVDSATFAQPQASPPASSRPPPGPIP